MVGRSLRGLLGLAIFATDVGVCKNMSLDGSKSCSHVLLGLLGTENKQ
jgi:hypothetical protein